MVRGWLLHLSILFASFIPIAGQAGDDLFALKGNLIQNGREILFNRIPSEWLRDEISPILELRFDSRKTFSTAQLKVALNGVYGCGHFNALQATAEWKQISGEWVLVYDLSGLKFDGSQSFFDRVKKIQKTNGRLVFWIRSPVRARAAILSFRRMTKDELPLVPPRVVIDQVEPAARFMTSSEVKFWIHAVPKASRLECRIDGGAFAPCASPIYYRGLRNGWHTFFARAFNARGKSAGIRRYDFIVWAPQPGVQITKVDPVENPTNQSSVQIEFRVVDGGKAECRLDAETFVKCVSPYRRENLASGSHTVEIRRTRSISGFLKPQPTSAFYTWTIDRKAPEIRFTSTPAILTNDDDASFSFEADKAVEFTCQLDGRAVELCVSPMSYRSLEEGTHRLIVRATDGIGNQAIPIEFAWNIDLTPPHVSVLSSNPNQTLTNLRTQSWVLQVSESASLSCRLDSEALPSCGLSPSVSNLTDGSHLFEVTPTDVAGNVGEPLSYAWTVDTSAPELTIRMVSPNRVPTNATSASFELIANGASSFRCSVDGFESPCYSDFSVNNLTEGDHSLRVVAIDSAGNESAPAEMTWAIDLTKPVITVTSKTPNEPVTQVKSKEISFESSEPTNYQCNFNQQGWSSCSSPFVVNQLADGVHRLHLRGADFAGNISEVVEESWRVYSVVVANIVSAIPSTSPTTSKTMQIEFAAEGASGFVCAFDGSSFDACASPIFFTGLFDGEHRFQVAALNQAGEIGPVTEKVWSVDATAPTVTLVSSNPVANTLSRSNEFNAGFSVDDLSSTTMCRLDSENAQPCSGSFNASSLADGTHTFTVTATDVVGNIGSTSMSWTIDATAPVLTFDATPDVIETKSVVNFVFHSTETVTLSCQLDASVVSNCQSPFQTGALSAGAHSFSVSASDGAGNNATPISFSWTYAPSASVLIQSVSPVGVLVSSKNMSVQFAGENASSFECRMDAGEWASCVSPVVYNHLSEGSHQFDVVARNVIGNASNPATYQWTVDSIAPAVSILALDPSWSPTSQSRLTASFMASEAASYFCSLDGAAETACTSPWTVTGLAAGSHSIAISAVDLAGNHGTPATYAWVVAPDPVLVGSISISSITRNSAVVSWQTNVPTTSQLNYGTGGNLNQQTLVDGNYVVNHSMVLTGLNSNTLYGVQPVSTDRDGRTVTGSTVNFRTQR